MADNIELNSGSGGATIATDEVGGAHHQYVKVEYGADGAATPVDATNCLPVVLKAETTKVIGTINVAAAQTIAVTNAGTFACQVDGAALTSLQLIDDAVYTDGSGTPSKGLAVMGTDGTNPQIIAVDSSGAVKLAAGTNQIGAVDLTKVAGASVAVANGTADTSLRVTIASDSTGQVKLTTGTASIGYLAAGSNLIGKVSIDQVTANANEVVVKSITAGDNNIGNVDIVTVPADPFGANADAGSATGSISAKLRYLAGTGIAGMTALPAGTNAIGKLVANSGVDIGDVDVTSQPARAATTDTITAKLATDAIQNGTTALTPKFAAISANTSGDNVLVDAVADKKIRVLALMLYAYGTAVNAYLRSEATGSIFGSSSAPIILDKTGATGPAGFCLPFNPVGWCQTVAGEHLHLNLSAAQYVGGAVVYVEV